MKLDVPFFKQTTPLNCGPSALKMVLDYFGKVEDISLLEKETRIVEGKGIYTIQIANASASLGFRTDFYSKSMSFNEENLKQEFYKKYADMKLDFEGLVNDSIKLGVNLHEKSISLEELLTYVDSESVPIVLLDWNIIKNNKKGYQGHFVPVVGFDENNIYVHDHGPTDPQEYFEIPKSLFDKARKAPGTDEDLVIIHKKIIIS